MLQGKNKKICRIQKWEELEVKTINIFYLSLVIEIKYTILNDKSFEFTEEVNKKIIF